MKLVIVESPAKAKTIETYLGHEYKVLASYGHIRDLPSKNGSVDPENNFKMTWEMDERSQKHVRTLAQAAKKSNTIYLATDPDREGEAISWHVLETLKSKELLTKKAIHRVVFNQITKSAVRHAIDHPRELDEKLIQAYLARRALDYLVGFTLSPILWRKLPGSRSAGRVQSVALRLVTDREAEIEKFIPVEYWSVDGTFAAPSVTPFQCRLVRAQGDKIEKMTLKSEAQTQEIVTAVRDATYHVDDVTTKPVKRNPTPPFITSTLQQEAARKLRFSAKKTMQIAQKLYEGFSINGETIGLITYMRTDSTNLAAEAVTQARSLIKSRYGARYVPAQPRTFTKKAKNAQEAHEAIRPTDATRLPQDLQAKLDGDHLKLYDLIWKRFVACQMAHAELDQTTILLQSQDSQHQFKTTGSVLRFDGFLKVYEEGSDEGGAPQDDTRLLPALKTGQEVTLEQLHPEQHFTQPPPRYTEASLVKKLEELGIGRPSTYASILTTLLDRGYASKDRAKLIPEARGRIVTDFLVAYFPRYVEYDFTAGLEEQLDNVASGTENWEQILQNFWQDFNSTIESASSLKISDVISYLNKSLEAFLFPAADSQPPSRACPDCTDGKLSLKLGKFGAFVGCSNYPECRHTRQLAGSAEANSEEAAQATALAQTGISETKHLGDDPNTGQEVTLRRGPYGLYFQWGEQEGKTKPKRVSIPKQTPPDDMTLELALRLGAFPKTLGAHPETGAEMVIGKGRFGPYVKYEGQFYSIPKTMDPSEVTITEAVDIIVKGKEKKAKRTQAGSKTPAQKTAKKSTSRKAASKDTSKKSASTKTTEKKRNAPRKSASKKSTPTQEK